MKGEKPDRGEILASSSFFLFSSAYARKEFVWKEQKSRDVGERTRERERKAKQASRRNERTASDGGKSGGDGVEEHHGAVGLSVGRSHG